MMRSKKLPLPWVLALLLTVTCCGSAVTAQDAIQFESHVQTLLASKCGKCHGVNKRLGGLDLSTMAGLLRGGESGEAVVRETLDDSLLWSMIEGGFMPPEGEAELSVADKNTIRAWIEAGARSNHAEVEAVTQHDILPYLFTRCVVCHGKRKQEAGLDLRTVESILKGGKSGPAVIPGQPEASLLLKRVLAQDMPPPKEMIRAGVRPLESTEVALITRWIQQGARAYDIQPDVQTTEPDSLVSDEDRQFWSFQTPRKPHVPVGGDQPIDAFILRKLSERDLTPSEQASKRTIIRRVAFDLTGLPPQWDDVQRFMHDESSAWYGKLVDFYLSSPHYGERWARYWLDVTGYADSEGKRSADPIRPHAWRYRDYVIRSLSADKPYNQFLIEQIAGDELYDFEHAEAVTQEMMDALVATGFLRMAPDGTGSDIVDTVDERFEVVADEIEVLGSAVLGLTLKCAQCHSHKYDPIPQRDYYRLVAVFRGAYDVYDWLKPTSVAGQSKQKAPTRRYLNYVTDDIRQQWEGLSTEFDAEIDAINQQLAERKKELGAKSDAYLKLKTQTNKKIKKLEAARPAEPMVRALWDRGEPSPTWIFRRGDFTNPGDLVGPGVPSVLSDGRTPFELKPKRPGSTGSRLAFANWLTDTEHPLTARVIVNRVWFHHFGRGIVASLENFGRGGVAPTHPELLDWLAVSFMENGWSLKWLHREIMLSAAYRQSSRLRPETEARDPDNRWLSRMPLRRLEAEAVRDSLLAISGQLDLTPFGEPDSVTVRADGLVTSERQANGWRRSVYIRQRRSEVPTILETFDLPQMIPNCVARPNSTVATQSLHLLNNGLVRELALAFAKQIQAAIPRDQNAQVQRAFEIALSRQPSDDERRAALDTIVELTAAWQKFEQEQAVDSELGPPHDTEQGESANTAQGESANTAQGESANTAQGESADAAHGESANPVPGESAETKALANLCHVLINSAECLFVD